MTDKGYTPLLEDYENALQEHGSMLDISVDQLLELQKTAIRYAHMRDMIKHFSKIWGKERGSNHYLHQIFPHGGPQKQGNRLAGLLRTKGEH